MYRILKIRALYVFLCVASAGIAACDTFEYAGCHYFSINVENGRPSRCEVSHVTPTPAATPGAQHEFSLDP